MAKITFNTNGVGIFKTTRTEAKTNGAAHASNPFGISFKGNVIQADVFQTTSNREGVSIRERGKMFVSAVVGNINSFNNAIKSRLNSVVSFGRQVKDNVANWWEQAKNTEITFDLNGLSQFVSEKFHNNPYGVNNLVKRPVNELEEMLKVELA